MGQPLLWCSENVESSQASPCSSYILKEPEQMGAICVWRWTGEKQVSIKAAVIHIFNDEQPKVPGNIRPVCSNYLIIFILLSFSCFKTDLCHSGKDVRIVVHVDPIVVIQRKNKNKTVLRPLRQFHDVCEKYISEKIFKTFFIFFCRIKSRLPVKKKLKKNHTPTFA